MMLGLARALLLSTLGWAAIRAQTAPILTRCGGFGVTTSLSITPANPQAGDVLSVNATVLVRATTGAIKPRRIFSPYLTISTRVYDRNNAGQLWRHGWSW